uniref:Uncharacterized protein n=1 Tax=Craspedostauros australis TaxID=1486917 RepID=A0A6T6GBE5_9STRA|mmetsp:Transcript_22513/g.62817  ORF Transcript_22513/g.62817 Transcript_22513/m.62817 type:complete len:117 (+) Transcript_22513:339-689(+)|eukprot:CAMPEP_0198109712 /NCGR_PEP_ID=MMETSP1442-20131203/1769_1 /TAXON_ID= /ORGANISM="Craspedostauros australis, Strain CCMP3328" /LENGTH=116 /DNA_ID=CAMNT_0043765493 /DNA_START=182 /DNA_END=532 /DNA_ORIENTATION=-
MRAAPIASTTQQFLGIDVSRTRSTESQEDTSPFRTPTKAGRHHQQHQQMISSSMSRPSSIFATPQRPRKDSESSWRTKETMGSIFRSPSQPADDIPDMFSIKRCLAFDDDDDEEEL